MQTGNLVSALIGSFIGLFVASIFKHMEKVNLNRNLRLMLAREIEENKHILSESYAEAEIIVSVGLRPHSFRFKMWESTMSQAPAFLSAKELSEVEVFYRNLRELQELNDYLKDLSNPALPAIVSRMKEIGVSLGRSFQCIGRQRLNFFNYFFVIWNQRGNTIGDLQYHFTYPRPVIIGRSYQGMSLFMKVKSQVKDAWKRVWYS